MAYCVALQGQSIQASGPTTFCTGGSVDLSVNPATNITGYQWIKGSTAIPGETNPTFNANSSGSYTVTIKRNSLPDTTIGPVAVNINPKPAVTVNQASFCVGLSATLTATGANSYIWSPSTGLSATSGASVTANPTATTTYTVTGTNSLGCSNTATSVVTVNSYPVAPNFIVNTIGQCANIPFNYNILSAVAGNVYTWDLGDGTNASGTSISHIYNAIGNGTKSYPVIVTAINTQGCSMQSAVQNVSVAEKPDPILLEANNFRFCGNIGPVSLNVTDISSPTNNITYEILWGGGSGSGNYLSAVPPSNEPHTYPTGIFTLTYNVTGTNNCKGTKQITVLNISNPRIGAGIPANASDCGPLTICFPINNFQNNHSSTLYNVDFGDGSPILTFPQPPPDSVCHTYTKTSCTAPNNKFGFQIQASNGCDTSYGSFSPIRVFTKPIAAFTISSNPTCLNASVDFSNTTILGYNSSCSVSAIYKWDFGDGSPVITVLNNLPQTHVYNTPGTFQVKLIAQNTCDTSSYILPICIEDKPVPAFSLSAISGCVPFPVTVNNSTTIANQCQNLSYKWTVSYSSAFCGTSPSYTFINGTSDTSANPSFNFVNPGIYNIIQEVSNACGKFTSNKFIDVKKPPAVTITIPPYPCGPLTITPSANVTACGTGTLTYSWSFSGGTPATSSAANPGPVSFSGLGAHAITLDVTNECGTTRANQSVIVTAAPDVAPIQITPYCGGDKTNAISFTSTVGPTNYRWTNDNPSVGLPSNGTGNLPSFTATNNSSVPQVANITVTPFVSANCAGLPISFTITVNPRPAAPIAISPITYCVNEVVAPLNATPAASNTLTWYNNIALTGGSAVAPTPATSSAVTTTYYVTQSNGFVCESAATPITVIVNPGIVGNVIDSNQNICANTQPTTLHTLNTVSGGSGSFAYQWQNSTDAGVTWANIPGATNSPFSPAALSATTQYRRIVNSNTCTNTSNIIIITVQGALSNYNIDASQTICEGVTPTLLIGQSPTGGGGSYSYAWEESTDNINWASPTGNGTGNDYQSGAIFQTTYFRRKLFAAQCNAISNVDTILINPTPKGTISAASNSICEYDPATINFTATTGTAPFNIEITVTAPGGVTTIIPQTINSNGPVTITVMPANSVPGTYDIVLTKMSDAKICGNTSSISTTSITVKPRPVLILSPAQTICNGSATVLSVSGAQTYAWSPSTALSSTNGGSVTANPTITTTYHVTGTTNNCTTDSTILVTVTPGTTIANAGAAQLLCNTASTTLAGNIAVTGIGSWSQLSGPAAVITDASLNNTTVTGLTGGQRYIFQWDISGLPPCPATFSSDTIDVLSPIINIINNDTVICSGQPVLLQTQSLSGGNTTGLAAQYTYQWEAASSSQNNWQPVPGAIQATLAVNPTSSTCYRRKIMSNNVCETTSNIVCITVNPAIGNNIISSSHQVCVNINPANLTGLNPTGGDNNYLYQWQTSTDSINWIDVSNNINYQPPVYLLAGTHYFRRTVTSGNCTSISNVISTIARPDSKAIFTSNPTIACAPFSLANAINVAALPDSNGLYEWFADGVLFGSNNTGIFPGYTILIPADTVLIKLRTTSQFGCKADSIEQQFATVITSVAKFVKDTSIGCGPLPVTFTNISSIVNGIQFFWDFGNGVKSTAAQPGQILFKSSPYFTDTTYKISLKAYNGCDTTVWIDSVKVSPDPKARFGVDTTFGCSPFTVKINNTSPEGINTYYWDFGNGDKDTTTSTGIFNYTYHIGNTVDTFTIRLIAENQCKRDTQTLDIRVGPNPIKPLINVNSSQLLGCATHVVSFNNNTASATSFTWDFGDGTPKQITNNTQKVVVHSFDKAGVFTISTDITNGCADTTVFRQVTVFAKPVASFTTNAVTYCLGDTIRVANNSQNATNYQWFWRDGTSSSGPIPIHVFTTAGSYPIFLQAEKTSGSGLVCYDTTVRTITVLAKPDATIKSNINAINCAPFKLLVSAPGVISENVTWYFYDSTVSPVLITASGPAAQYTFNKPGTFFVKIIAINAAGCKDSTILPFTVRGKAVASFTPSNVSICIRDTTISYVNTTTYNGTDPISYKWLVDQVPLSSNGNFTHRFTVTPVAQLPKIFTVSLVVSNTVGCNDTANATLQMNQPAKALFSISNPNACVPFKPNITNNSTSVSIYKWLLNGVQVSTAAIPNIVILQASTVYTITLIADNIYGCKPDSFSVTFTSRVKPIAAFTLSDTLGCTGVLNVATKNTTTLASTYIWNWGDGSANSILPQPTYLYKTQGQYLVTLVASDGVCTDTAQQLVKVSVNPVVNFSVDQMVTCDTAKVQFTNLTQNGNNYVWSFGDGTSSISINPSKFYPPKAAPYTIKLVASSSFGCKDSAVKANLILAKVPPASDFFISPNPVITVPSYTFNFNNLTLNSVNYKYLWSLGDGSFSNTRDVTHKYVDTGNYTIRLIVLDTVSNCPDTTIRIARIDGFPGYLYVPNAICPACIQSGLRNFIPKGAGLKEYRLQIYTTWNELVFETRALDSKGSPTEAWDGTWHTKPKRTNVQQDVYVWRIDAKLLNGSEWLGMIYPGEGKYKKTGTITVVR